MKSENFSPFRASFGFKPRPMAESTVLRFPPSVKDAIEKDRARRDSEKFDDPTVIKVVRIDLSTEDIILEFENETNKFSLAIFVQNKEKLDWRECAVLSESLDLFRRGMPLRERDFFKQCESNLSRHGGVRGPVSFNGQTHCDINPVPAYVPYRSKNMISYASITSDAHNNICFSAFTNKNGYFKITIHLDSENGTLYEEDSCALVEIVKTLEVGESLNQNEFYDFLRTMREKFNFLTFAQVDQGCFDCRIVASYVKNHSEIDERLLKLNPSEDAEYVENDENSDYLVESPYPGIMYTTDPVRSRNGKVVLQKGIMDDEKKVVIKIFDISDRATLKAYGQELKVSLRVPPCKNVVNTLDVFQVPKPAIVTDMIEGETLHSYLKKNGRCTEEEGLKLAIGIANGILHMHNNGMVHRDIKSPNIMLDLSADDPTPVIVDFGLSNISSTVRKQAKSSTKRFFQQVGEQFAGRSRLETCGEGTLLWVAPEIVDREWSQKSDVYSFAIVLWEIFSGFEPYSDGKYSDGSNSDLLRMIVSNNLRPDINKIGHLSPGLRSLIQSMWSADPSERPLMSEILDSLQSKDPKKGFAKADANGDGELSEVEFIAFLQDYAPSVTEQEASKMFFSVDSNKDGSVSFNEFKTFWNLVLLIGLEKAFSVYSRTRSLYMSLY